MKGKTDIFIAFFCGIFLIGISGSAQVSKTKLEEEKKENLTKIEETKKILTETRSKKDATMGQLSALNAEIVSRRSLISSIGRELRFLDAEIADLEELTSSMEADLSALKEEYAAMVYAASKSSGSVDRLAYLFSAESFDQMIMRLRYLQHYTESRKLQMELIEQVALDLHKQKKKIAGAKTEKNELLNAKMQENSSLVSLKSEHDKLIRELSTQEKELKKELEEKEKAVEKLEALIADIVKKEIKISGNEGDTKIKLTPETALLSSNFAGNKRRLSWPVKHGFISQKFGQQEHAVLKGVMINNLGVEIQTNADETVRTVFEGVISTVATVPGMNKMVMVQHGEYFTVYANLKEVYVKSGQKVNAHDSLGKVYTNKDNITELQFQIWKNSNNVDPETWLFKK